MAIEIKINDSLDPKARYITYAPSRCQIRQTPAAAALTVTLSSRAAPSRRRGGGVLRQSNGWRATDADADPHAPGGRDVGGLRVGWQAGEAERRRSRLPAGGVRPAHNLTVPLMVRVRKNANKLKSARARPISAGAGQAQQLRVASGSKRVPDAAQHARAGRRTARNTRDLISCRGTGVYLLDLERQLQAIDPSVSMHYWRFDEPAPNVFTSCSWARRVSRPATASFVSPRSGESARRVGH